MHELFKFAFIFLLGYIFVNKEGVSLGNPRMLTQNMSIQMADLVESTVQRAEEGPG